MPSTKLVPVRDPKHSEESAESAPQHRDETTQALLDDTDAILDAIEEVLEVEPPPVKPFTLSELIRKGSELAPQAFGSWVGPQGETCALSAALAAAKAEGLL